MKIQIIIPILNPKWDDFKKILELLQMQTMKCDILLINSGKNNISITCSMELINIEKEEFNHATTRNKALFYEADFYLFMTQDALPYDEHLVANLYSAFVDSDVVVAYARQLPYLNADHIEIFARCTNYSPTTHIKSMDDLPTLGIKTFFCSDSCAMYRADYFRSMNGFKDGLQTNEDMEFAARAILNGKKVAYLANAKVYHSHDFTYKEVWKRYCTIGTFFADNRWILNEVSKYKKVESMGIKQALKELIYLTHKAPLLIPRSIIFSLIKFIAFKSRF